MTPLSHTTHTTPAAPEQAGDNAEPPIANLTNVVFIHHLLPYLGPEDLSHTGQACRRFNDLSRRVWQQRAQEICRTCAELLPSFDIMPPGAEPTPEEAKAFLKRTVRRVKEINGLLPGDVRSQFSVHDLVCKVDPRYMQEFLQKAYDHSLRIVFRGLADVPEDASLEEAVRLIREWLPTAEAGQIQELNLAGRGLVCLPGEIGRLTALQNLFLMSNQLTSIPPEIGRLTALQNLVLTSNQLTSLSPQVGQLQALQKLILGNNHLKSIPPEIGQLTALQQLDLSFNRRLASLPHEIGQLAALQQLELSCNQFMSFPPEIGQLTALQELCLAHNQLTSLPQEIGRLTALQRLYLIGNRLTSLPPEIGRLTALHTLTLSRNQIASLPPETGQLTALQLCCLDGNPLTSLPPEIEWLNRRHR